MDGSYGNVYPSGRAMSVPPPPPPPKPAHLIILTASCRRDPNAPPQNNPNQYKVNVSRQKTKKWANFKPQNYDGDDWGDEDEFAEEEEPLPPPPVQRPMGPRHAATFSPSSSAGQFQPPGSPPLQTNTAQFPSQASTRLGQHQAGVAPSPLSGGPPRRVTEPVGSFPHSAPGHSQPHFLPDPRGTSPTPQSAHALPSQQIPTPTSAAGPSPVPDVPEARSTTPRSADVASPTRLPFVRPADLYRRMEEERGKEARPSETPTSSTAAAGGWSREPTGWQPQAQPQPQPQGGFPGQFASSSTEDTTASWAPRPSGGLATVPERRSEYGLEGFIDSYGSEAPNPAPAPVPAPEETAPVVKKSARAASGEDLRRYSTSPQLPDLGRVSGFGDDFFSSSTFFPASELESPASGNVQQPPQGQYAPDAGNKSPTPAPEGPALVAGSTPQSAGPTITSLEANNNAPQQAPATSFGAGAPPSPVSSPVQDAPVGLTSHQGVAQPGFSPPAAQAPAPWEPATLEQSGTRSLRPHLPGGWVSETPSTPGATASPLGGPPQEETNKAVEPEPTAHVDAEVRATSPSVPSQLEPTEARGYAELEKSTPAPSPSIAAPAVPLLRTASPALSAKPEVDTLQTASEVPDRAASASPAIQAAERSPAPESATMEHSRVITPTAPLKSQRSTPDSLAAKAQPVVSLPPAEPEPAPNASPVEDSDMLSEEIMKSLSPIQPAGSAVEAAPGSTASYHAAAPPAEPIRESSYLGDVYGDYWAATEDKAEPGILGLGKAAEPETAALKEAETLATKSSAAEGLGSSSPVAPTSAVPAPAPEVQPSTDAGPGPGRLQRRFSWEAPPEEPVPTTVLTPAAEPAPVPVSAAEKEVNLQQPSPISDATKSAEDLRAESAPEFNPGASLSPTDRPIPSPSPVSDLTDSLPRTSTSQAAGAEEKIALPSLDLSPPVSPAPLSLPQDKPRPDTAASNATQQQQQQLRRAESPSTPTIAFRKIMDMPLPSERIKQYHESRYQISSLDSGLDDWLRAMVARHPEHASALLSPASATTAPLLPGGGGGAPAAAGRMQTGAGMGSGAGTGPHLHMPNLQHGLSGLGHSGGQVGVKSKELLMAAGKAGKGLFSKGRNKLRERGDKVFSSGGQ